jgi:parallel beta-helix repeat protein
VARPFDPEEGSPVSRRRLLALGALLLLLAGGALGVVLRPAQATVTKPAVRAVAVSCGQTITATTTVSNDLTDCSGDGLVIGANGVVLNLGGHTIDGSGSDTGIANNGFDNVTIQNGTLTGFLDGVSVGNDANANKLLTLRVHDNAGVGIIVEGSSDNAVISGNTAYANTAGIHVLDSAAAQLTTNTTSGNDAGIILSETTGAILTGNKAISNGITGVTVNSASSATQLKTTTASSNDLNGIDVQDATAKISGTVANFNTQLGVDAAPGVADLGKNTAKGNGDAHQCESVVCS